MGNTAKLAKGAIPYSEFPYSGQPSDAETATIGSDVYEFCTDAGSVAADTRIGVVIGGSADATAQNFVDAINAKNKTDAHATLFRTNGTTPARANGREKFRAVLDSTNNIVYLYAANKAGGQVLTEGGAPDKALSDTATNMGPWKHLNANLSVGGATAVCEQSADLVHTVTAANLSATQPLKVPIPFAPKSWQVQVRDSAGVLKDSADVTVTVPTAVSGQNFLGLTLNAVAAGDAGVLVRDIVVEAAASANRAGYFSAEGKRPVKVVQVDGTVKAAVAGGTLTFDATKTAADGTETPLASAVNIATLSAHDPTALTFDDAALPQTLAAGEKIGFVNNGGSGLTANDVTYSVHFKPQLEAGDVIHIHVAG